MEERVRPVLDRFETRGDLISLLLEHDDPERIAFRIVDAELGCEDITFADLLDAAGRLASSLLALGIKPRDRIATLMDKGRDHLIAILATWWIGAVHVPLFTAFAFDAIDLRLEGSDARAIIFHARYRKKLTLEGGRRVGDRNLDMIAAGDAEANELDFATMCAAPALACLSPCVFGPVDPIIHMFTSGTTGKAKGVEFPRRGLASLQAYGEFGLDLRTTDIYWNAADPGWAYGLYFAIILPMLFDVPSILLSAGFSAELSWHVLDRFGVTNFAAAPTVYRALMAADAGQRRLSLRCAASAGEPLTIDINRWAPSALGVRVHDHYGQTETGMLINNHQHPDLRQPLKPGSMGIPMPGWSAAILDETLDELLPDGRPGRLAIDLTESPLAWFTGYSGVGTGDKVSADGRWFFTGDVALRDADGNYFFAARDDDVIIMAGYRIGPFEIEMVLCEHPAVADAAVIAVPDPLKGEIVEAHIVLGSGRVPSPHLAQELQQWVKTRYAAHAYPRRIQFTDALPRTPSGKVQRFVLRNRRRAELAGKPQLLP